MCGLCVATQDTYFACKKPKFAMEIKISMRQIMEFPLDVAFSQNVTFLREISLDLQFTHMKNLIVYMGT